MRPSSIIFAVSACLAMALSTGASGDASASATDYGPTIAKITKLAGQQMGDYGITGLSIALVDGQKVVWEQGFGYADKANGVEVTPDTVFEIGSNSKPLTAVAVMQLVERGKINLDLPLKRYLPGFTIQNRILGADPAQITTRLLMTNHSGIPYIAAPITGYSYRPGLMKGVPNILRHDWLAYRPNTMYAYSNLGGALAGLVVEKVSAQDFTAYTQKHIFDLLDMDKSSFAPLSKLDPYLSRSYDRDGNELKRLYMNYPPAGGAYSSASDLTHFIKALFAKGQYGGKTLIKPASLKEMWSPQNLGVALDFDYRTGLYWLLTDPELKYAGKSAGFAGDTAHQHSRFMLLPDHQLGVVVLTNSALGNPVARTLGVATLQSALKDKKGISPPGKPTHPAEATVSARKLAACAGLYAGSGTVASMSVEGNHLLVKTFAGTSYKLVPLKNGNFKAVGAAGMEDYEYAFETVGIHQMFVQVWYGVKLLPFLTKIGAVPVTQAWKDRVGNYNIKIDPDFYPFYSSAKLIVQKGVLTLVVGNACYALRVVTDTTAVMQGLGIYLEETVRIETKDGIEQLIFENYAFEKAS